MSEQRAANSTEDFQSHRQYLRALAYRMLGSRAEAEDVLQDAWLRWQAADRHLVHSPNAFLSQVVTNLCLDRLQSARQRREQYVGVWLPEPLVAEAHDFSPGPELSTEYAQDVSIAFLLALERLSPLERAAFLLHDVFDLDFEEIGMRLQRSPAACRQLASRARQHVRENYSHSDIQADAAERLLKAFDRAIAGGDVENLAQLLTGDAMFLADGGGEVSAVARPLTGAKRIAKALIGFAKLENQQRVSQTYALINGLLGIVQYDVFGRPVATRAFRFTADGRVASIYIVRNPKKLVHVKPLTNG